MRQTDLSQAKICLQLLSIVLLLRIDNASGQEPLPHVDDCNFCDHCVVDGEPPSTHADNVAGLLWNGGYGHLLAPIDVEQKAAKQNCTNCRGCNVQLTPIDKESIKFGSLSFKHGKGATNSWHFFATRPGMPGRYIVKVYCIPAHKDKGFAKLVQCSAHVYSERMEIMIANQMLAEECGVQELYPKVWLAKISATLPGLGFHIRWHGLWMEEAKGATLYALTEGRARRTLYELMSKKLNSSQVVAGAVMDLLTGQCDRHGENVFIDTLGQLQFIDQDKSLGVISKCGYDSMLLPGTRYHSVLRVGYWLRDAARHRRARQQPDFCRDKVDMRVVVDYRCHVTGVADGEAGELGTLYPVGFSKCMKRIGGMSVSAIQERYNFSKELPASLLKNRSIDMVTRGFEWTLANGMPLSDHKHKTPVQPPCCKLALEGRVVTCHKCWKPVYPEDISNSTDMRLVSPLHE